MEGTSFGRYRLIELLGRGGMGEVWRAHDTTIDRVVAIKMLLPHYAEDAEYEARFRREAHAAARLEDPHIVPIYDVGEIDGRLYVTMRLINGRDLQSILADGPLPPARAVHVIEQVASALHHAHQTGLVHRDVKPSNILLDQNDFAYLIDFGIARGAGDTALTAADSTIGTWAYMAPERFTSGDSHPSADVYALACVLYQCLTGDVPFPGATFEQVASGHLMNTPPVPSQKRAEVPAALDEVVATGLAKKPAERYPSTIELARAARYAAERPTDPGRATPAIVPYPDTDPRSPAAAQLTQPWQSSTEAPTAVVENLPPSQPPSGSRERRRLLLIGALVAVAALVAGAVFAMLAWTGDDDPVVAQPSSSESPSSGVPPTGPPPNTGPFTGVYRAEFGRTESLDGAPAPDGVPLSSTYGVRSACGGNGCVATASVRDADDTFAPAIVFDEVGDDWLSVAVAPGVCRGVSTETWQSFRLAPRPDGTLEGVYVRSTPNNCAEKRSVTFTRTGDVDVDADFFGLPDPGELPPRVVSPAEGLHGRYHFTRTFSEVNSPVMEADTATTTYCLRAGDRCMSYFAGATGDQTLLFANGKFTSSTRMEAPCPAGDLAQLTADITFDLPQPPQNPIVDLRGTGTWVQTGSCTVTAGYTETFTRTGD